MTYKIDGTNTVYSSIDDVLDYCVDRECYIEDDIGFVEYLDSTYPKLDVAGIEMYVSDVLRSVDREAYEELKSEWADSWEDADREDLRGQLERASGGDEVYYRSYTVYVYDDEEEESEPAEISEETIKAIEEKLELKNKIQQEANKKQKETEDQFTAILQLI